MLLGEVLLEPRDTKTVIFIATLMPSDRGLAQPASFIMDRTGAMMLIKNCSTDVSVLFSANVHFGCT